ncbi:copper/silver-translocating P-type ATPase [Natranaerovirga hydrolytica]|uniref:Cd(2+)-exporting ATPase n=1 Tax=Natranaerovirga hydrolytica TaxID=680378 RepID=A0A4V2Q078_9FIRM|nr:cation-translocating P-type ATPase [Natranaerovirga hydrolytica]TCK92611.1 copper/silver-translocating P-type ATPase [Natranaerovirga hydrolytica]
MNNIIGWLKEEDRLTIVYTAISALFLILSFTTQYEPFGINLAWGAILISGTPIVYGSFKRLIFYKDIKAGLLVSIALIACILVGEYFAAGEVVVIMMIGELLEDYTVRRSKMGLKNLIALQPTKARVLRNGAYEMIESQEVRVGDKIRIIAGEAIPVDGMIIEGITSIDQSVMTGESIPVEKSNGDDVFSATVNTYGTIVIEAKKVGEDSSIAKMIHMIKEAETKKAPILSVMDRWASYLVVIALVLSVLIGLITQDILRAITVLVVFCPCALVLATPTAIAAGIGNATKHGIIVKSGEALERLGKVARVVFDKTGTLTIGEPEVNNIMINQSVQQSEEEFLRLVSSAQLYSEHPLGVAIRKFATANNHQLVEPKDFQVIPGKGVIAQVESHEVVVGNPALIASYGFVIDKALKKKFDNENEKGNTAVLVAIDKKVAGIITLSDQLRPDSGRIVNEIYKWGAKISLLTGDNEKVALKIANEVGINEYIASALPEDKVKTVESYEASGQKTCMVGDGINDAPALKTAFVSIAMAGIGSDIATESADIVLVKDDLIKLPYIMKLSRDVIKKINQNIIISMVLNFGAIGLAGFGLLNPVTGALVHNVGSVLVVINAAFLLNKNKGRSLELGYQFKRVAR